MKSYPVHVNRASYRGADRKKQAKNADYNRIAAKVEAYLNKDLAERADDLIQVYMSYSVAAAIEEDDRIVHDVIYATDGGSTGITVLKGDYNRAIDKLTARQAGPR